MLLRDGTARLGCRVRDARQEEAALGQVRHWGQPALVMAAAAEVETARRRALAHGNLKPRWRPIGRHEARARHRK